MAGQLTQMKGNTDWGHIVDIVSNLENDSRSQKPVRELMSYINEFRAFLNSSDSKNINVISFLFQKSILPILNDEGLSPSLIEGILLTFDDLLKKKVQLSVDKTEASQLICFVLKEGIELQNKRELFEEIGTAGIKVLKQIMPEKLDIKQGSFLISVMLEYATKSTFVHGLDSVEYLELLIKKIDIKELRSILPGVSVALTTLIIPKNNHKIINASLRVLKYIWMNAELTEEDGKKLGGLIERIFKQEFENYKTRREMLSLSAGLIEKNSDLLKDSMSSCIRCIFAAVADDNQLVVDDASLIVEKLGGSVQVSAEFENCINDLKRTARSNDEQKRLILLRTISAIISINKGKDNDFDSQILTSLNSLAVTLLFVSEIKANDTKICEVDGGFILRRRPYLNTQKHMESFLSIVDNLPVDEFVEVLIDILSENGSFAPEIFYIFGLLSQKGPVDLMMSIIEQPNWWTPKQSNPRSVLTLEMALETSAKLFGTSMLQQLLYRIIECLASPYPSVEQTAKAVLEEIAPEGNVGKLLMDNVDYITDRLIARLQFVDVSPEVLTVFNAIVSVDGDISDLLSHLLPKIYELLDTRDNFSLPILRAFPRVIQKIPSECENIVDRCIHFVLSPAIALQCAALDSLITAIPNFENEDKLLPMIHQMWGPSILLMKSSVDCSNPATRRSVIVVKTALKAARSFVKGRVRDLLPILSSLLTGNLSKLKENNAHRHAFKMLQAILDLFQLSLENDNVFESLDVEVFTNLIKCFDIDIDEEIKTKAQKCLSELYDSSRAFVWALLIEVTNQPLNNYPYKIKPTKYINTPISKDVRVYLTKLLNN